MNNCLVTKLKGTVDNNSLRKLGEIELFCGGRNAGGSGSIQIFSLENSPTEVYNVSGNFNASGTDVKTVQATEAGVAATFKQYDTIRFKPENIRYFSCKSNLIDNPLYLGYFTNLVELYLMSSNGRHKPAAASFGEILDAYAGPNISSMALQGYDLSDWNFSDFATRFGDHETIKWISQIIVQETGININIADLAYFGNFNGINLYKTHTYGSIESYVQLARQKWPSKTSMSFDYGNPEDTLIQITFNGQTVDHSTFQTHALSWTGNTITFDGVTINA